MVGAFSITCYIFTKSSIGFKDESALLKHELAYCLGQIQKTSALPILESVLANTTEDPMVRHEVCCSVFCYRLCLILSLRKAAEAMGAISASKSIPVLKKYLSDSNQSVRETCEIAIARIEWDNSEEGQLHKAATKDEETIPYALPNILLVLKNI